MNLSSRESSRNLKPLNGNSPLSNLSCGRLGQLCVQSAAVQRSKRIIQLARRLKGTKDLAVKNK